jgi:hypothetical protein
MTGITNLSILLKSMKPVINDGRYVYCSVQDVHRVNFKSSIGIFKEPEGITVILKKEDADLLELEYTYIAAWITLNVHSSLTAVGLTAAVSSGLSQAGISCNVVAAYFHDHIFVDYDNAENAIAVLNGLSKNAFNG